MTNIVPAAPSLPALPVEISNALSGYAYAARGALSENTTRALRSDSAVFSAWCLSQGAPYLPAAPEDVADFVDAMAQSKAVATVRRYVATIAHLHRAANAADPTKSPKVRLALRRAARAKGTRQRQALGLTQARANAILDTMGDSLRATRDRAVLLVARDLLARRSELVALDVADITMGDDGTATVLIRRSKVDQEGAGAVRLIGPGATSAVRAWLSRRTSTSPALFVSIDKSGREGDRIEAGSVARILKRLAAAAGLDAAAVSGHSARVGMAQDLAAAGCELAEVMQAGRWSTPTMVSRYSEHLQAKRGAVAKFYGLR